MIDDQIRTVSSQKQLVLVTVRNDRRSSIIYGFLCRFSHDSSQFGDNTIQSLFREWRSQECYVYLSK